MSLAFFAFLFSTAPVNASPRAESVLKFEYQVQCDPQDHVAFPGIIADVNIGSRRIRTYLLRYQTEQAILLGIPTKAQLAGLTVDYHAHASCKLQSVRQKILPLQDESLEFRHSPYVVLRPDQQTRPDRDIPFHLGYSKLPRDDGGFALRYTIYFSNETDSGMFATSKSKSMALWGRRTDIEWIYEVVFNAKGKAIDRTYQGGVVMGIGHAIKSFRGKFIKGTRHPILYNIARHNVFSDQPEPGQSSKTVAAHLGRLEEIPTPEAREDWMWRNPWSFDLSDRELRRTGELSFPSQDYLYVRLTGDIGRGRLAITGSDMTMDRITLTQLGEDLWKRSDFTAFRIRRFPGAAQSIGKSIEFTPSTQDVKIEQLRFLRLIPDPRRGFVVRDITPLFECDASRCRY